MHATLAQAAPWFAAAGCGWAMVRAGAAKRLIKAKPPARCAACGRQKVRGRCPCTDD